MVFQVTKLTLGDSILPKGLLIASNIGKFFLQSHLILSFEHCQAREAFVTLATTDSYCMGAIVVARSLRHHGTTRSVVVLVTPNISEQSRWVMHFL